MRPGRVRLTTKPLPIGSETLTKTIGMAPVSRESAATSTVLSATMISGLLLDDLLCGLTDAIDFIDDPSIVHSDIAAIDPTESRKP